MASRFDQWVGTAPIKLPIDTYRTVAMVNEQKTQQALDNIGQTMAAYEQISPFSKDAQAVYDQSMDNLRNQVTAAAKLDLKTPDAKRKINQIIRDPNITMGLKNVMTDSLLAQQRIQERNEYLKKNPDINTYEYNRALGMTALEKGDASKFNPNRFKSLGPLVEYTDVNKLISEGVDKLKANKEHFKDIFGQYYIEESHGGVTEDRIRKYVANQLATNPLVSEQMRRNLENTIYRQDPYDRDAGIKKLADTYRNAGNEQLTSNIATLNDRITKFAKGKTKKELATSHDYANLKEQLKTHLQMRDTYNNPDSPDYADDTSLINNTFRSSFVNGFDQLASHDDFKSRTYNEWAKAQWDLASKLKAIDHKHKLDKELLSPDPMPVPSSLPESQKPVLPGDLKSVISRTPGLEGVGDLVGEYGEVKVENLKKAADKSNAYAKINSLIGGATNLPISVGPPKEKEGFWNQVLQNTFKVPVSVGVGEKGVGKVTPEVEKKLHTDAIEKITKYLKVRGSSPAAYNNFATELDLRHALEAIARNKTDTERIYGRTYTTLQSNTDEARGFALGQIHKAGLLNADGSQASEDDLKQMDDYFQKYKPLIENTPAILDPQTGKFRDQSYYTFNGPNGKTFHTPMGKTNNEYMGVYRATMANAIDNQGGYVYDPHDKSISLVDMAKDGDYSGKNIPLGGTPQYQFIAQNYWTRNVRKLTKIGYTEEQAGEILNDNYDKIMEGLAVVNKGGAMTKPTPLETEKGTVMLDTPVKRRGQVDDPKATIYYSDIPLADWQPRIQPLDQYLDRGVKSFQSPTNNPGQTWFSPNFMRAETKERMMFQKIVNDNYFGD